MRRHANWALVGLAVLFLAAIAAAAPSKEKPSSNAPKPSTTLARNPYRGAIVIDAVTGRVLFEDNADVKGYPASMQKLLGLFIILEQVQRGVLSLEDQVPVSAKAANTGGSQVWLAHKEVFSVEEMLYALMIQSANDAAVALAEKVAGSTEAFVELMNAEARALGMNASRFHSVHGLPPSAGQDYDVSTARDFAILSRALLLKHPEALRYTSARQRVFRPSAGDKALIMRTHNHLLATLDGCDGLKTGFFSKAGYSIAVTAARQGQRVIVIVLDSVDYKTRDRAAAELAAKGFALLRAAAPAARPAPAPPAGATAR